MKNIDWKKSLPYVLIIIGFLAICYSFMSPLLSGKSLYQHDIVQSMGMNKEIMDIRNESGRQILWTNRPFAGMPAFMLTVKFKYNILSYIQKAITIPTMFWNNVNRPAILIFLMIFFFFIAALIIGIDKWLSAIGAVCLGLSTFWLVSLVAGHNSKLVTYAYMAPTIASLIYAYKKNAMWGALFFTLFLGLSLKGHHIQITYYTFLIGIIFFINEFIISIKEKTLSSFGKTTLILGFAALLAIGLNSNQLYSTYVHSKETTRGGKSELADNSKDSSGGLSYDYATAWSYGIKETGTLIIPNFAGGASTGSLTENSSTYNVLLKKMPKSQAKKTIQQLPIYYGKQSFTAGPTYSGAIIMFLFVLALFVLPNRHRWWMLAATLLSAFLAWGSNSVIYEFFYYNVPLFNKFRTPAMALSMITFLFPFMAILGLSKFFEEDGDKEKLKKGLIYSGAITAGFCLLTMLFGGSFWTFEGPSDARLPAWLVEPLSIDRVSVLKSDALRSFVLILAAFALLWFYLKEKISLKILLPILAVLCIGDLYTVGKRYVKDSNFSRQRDLKKSLKPQFNDAIMRNDKSQFRIWNSNNPLDKDGMTSYNYNSLSGYSAAKLLLYQDLIDYQISKGRQPALNMLNTKYIIQKGEVIKNDNACGNAWFASKITYANDPKDAMQKLNNFNACSEAVLDNKLKDKINNAKTNGSGSIQLSKYDSDKLTYNVNTDQTRLAVFSEIYYSAGGGWKAMIDGKEAEVLKVNYALRGLIVPQGSKKIEFEFNPGFYRTGEMLSLISSLLFLGILGFLLFRSYKTRSESK